MLKRKGQDPFPLMCKAAGLGEPVKEHRFHPVRKWRVDYFFPRLGLAVEVEGGIFIPGGSRHSRGAGFRADCEKYNNLTILGIHLMRFLPEQVRSGQAIIDILDFATQVNKREIERMGGRE